MTEPAQLSPGAVWEEEGRRAASALDRVSSAVVVGRDPDVAASVALGIARAQAERRRVALADLVGEAAPLQALVGENDDPHGVSDSFRYGVSLNKIARPADTLGNLFVLPSGSEAVAVEEVFRSDRWRRLAGGFREVGALLLLVAQADTPGLDALVASVDGVVVAGDATGALPDAAPPLAVVAARAARRAPRAPRGVGTASAPARTAEERERVVAAAPAWRRWAALALAALTVAVALLFYLRPTRTGRTGDVPRPRGAAAAPRGDTSAATDASAPPAAGAATSADSTAAQRTAARADREPLEALTVANPGDSANAVRWSVHLDASPSETSLNVDPRLVVATIAITPVIANDAPWYRQIVGAYASRAQAESLLVALRRRKVLGPTSGQLVNAPYALLVADRVPMSDVPVRVRALKKRGVSVYPLSRGDGTAALYAGAFELPQDAAYLARTLRAAGVTPVLVYRTGRSL